MTATLLGLPPQIAADQRFLIVDTERAAGSAASLLPAYTVLRPSLDGALDDIPVDALFALQGCDVLIWPSNIPATRTAAELLANRLAKLTDRLRMVYVNGVDPPFFSATDMAGWEPKAVVAWARERTRTWEVTQPHVASELPPELQPDEDDVSRETPKRTRRGKPRTKPDGHPPGGTQIEATESAFVSWESMGLSCSSSGTPFPNISNIQLILASHPELSGRLWFDEFHGKVFQTLFQSQPVEWADHHDTRLTIWMQRDLRLAKIAVQNVRLAVDEFARLHPRNEPRSWMESLKWGGEERLSTLLADGFGTVQNDYTAAVGRCFLMGMAARIYQPGAKVDNMPVFEGSQGIRKSTALRTLGGPWFAEMHEDMTSKDFLQNLPGKMLIEISELHAFRRADINRIKGIISCSTDRYRASYGRRSEDHPRRGVWAGTTNTDDWVQDDTGARRFWPVACGEINLEYLSSNRDQLFAEAVHRFKAGESWWDVDYTLAKSEQDDRRDADPWTDVVLSWCSSRPHVRVPDVLSLCLSLPLHMQDKASQMRIASILRVAGWKRRTMRDRLVLFKGWSNPVVTGGNADLGF
jgi:predicted P-loop ATPase